MLNGRLHRVESMPISNFNIQSPLFSLNKPYRSCLALFKHRNEYGFLICHSSNSNSRVQGSNFISNDQALVQSHRSSIQQHFQQYILHLLAKPWALQKISYRQAISHDLLWKDSNVQAYLEIRNQHHTVQPLHQAHKKSKLYSLSSQRARGRIYHPFLYVMEYLWCNICLLLRPLILVFQFLGRSPLRTHGNSQLRPYWYDKMPPRLHLHDAHRYQGTELLGKPSAAPVYIKLCHQYNKIHWLMSFLHDDTLLTNLLQYLLLQL